MKRIPKLYNSTEKELILKLTTRADKFGNVFFCVSWYKEESDCIDYATFENMSSAMDFIKCNFNK